MRPIILCPLLLLLACETTPKRPAPTEPGEAVTISADELEPVRRFALETRRVLAAEFVRIEASQQFFEQQMGYTRDPRYVARSPVRILRDGTRVIVLKRIEGAQVTNIDPDLLPRVYFGGSGLEIRAFREIRIYLSRAKSKERPLFLRVEAKSVRGPSRLWVGGRLQEEKPDIRIRSVLIWSPDKERYVHRSSIG